MVLTRRERARKSSVSASQTKPRRILAIDYGRKKIGLALSDELGLTARPLTILMRTNRQNDLRHLREICRQNGVTHIIVGHPLHLTGAAGEMADEAGRFSARLARALGIAVELVDERLTSWEAERMAAGMKAKPRKGRALDDVAAAILLRDYLERTSGPAHTRIAEKG